ncbi:MAG: SDR family NAD(P)-dependent oxidoreductase [Devosia sp.]
MKLEGKTALVTGGGAGIGEASALAFAQAGADVIVTGLNEGDLANVAAQIRALGRKALPVVCDVGDEVAMAALFAQIEQEFGHLDCVLANAGINGVWAPIEEITPDEWDRTMRVNMRGTYLTIHHAVPLMKARGGSIAIISSINGTRTFSTGGASAYSASKAGQMAFGQMLALELAKHKIRVNVVCPGSIRTRISESTFMRNVEAARHPVVFPQGFVPLSDGKAAAAAEVANAVTFLASDDARHITGTPIYVDGGQSLIT